MGRLFGCYICRVIREGKGWGRARGKARLWVVYLDVIFAGLGDRYAAIPSNCVAGLGGRYTINQLKQAIFIKIIGCYIYSGIAGLGG